MEEEEDATVAVCNPSHQVSRPCKIKRSSDLIDGGEDSISDLPDEILHHIFSFIPTRLVIRTSVLSKRWRHIWSETPHLSFEYVSHKSISKTLVNHSASKITSFQICTSLASEAHYVNSWIEFAITHNVQNLSLSYHNRTRIYGTTEYDFPDFFYTNSSVKQLLVSLLHVNLISTCIVSWTSLRNLSLNDCNLSDESFLKILSGSPNLESLKLQFCNSLHSLDLSQSLHLRRLEVEIELYLLFGEPMKIVAPHIHYLKLKNFEGQYTLVDVSSLTEADVDFTNLKIRTSNRLVPLKPDVLLAMVQTMLEKFQNVEKLTLGVNFLQILSFIKITIPLPTLKVKSLTIETMIVRSVIPGIARLLQNSPELNKLLVYTVNKCSTLLENCVNKYLDSQDLNSNFPNSWRYEYQVVGPELIASFMELLLANTKTLETLVVRLGSCIKRSRFEELFQIAGTLSHNNKVSIVLK